MIESLQGLNTLFLKIIILSCICSVNVFCCPFREYGAIDDVDIDLHIDVSFLDVSIKYLH